MDIESVRLHFGVVNRAFANLGWTDQDLADLGQAVKAAMTGADAGLAECWANWLALQASLPWIRQAASTPRPRRPDCFDCQHLAKPGRSDGYCVGREDLPRAYGPDHPFRALPPDRGASCRVFVREWP